MFCICPINLLQHVRGQLYPVNGVALDLEGLVGREEPPIVGIGFLPFLHRLLHLRIWIHVEISPRHAGADIYKVFRHAGRELEYSVQFFFLAERIAAVASAERRVARISVDRRLVVVGKSDRMDNRATPGGKQTVSIAPLPLVKNR